MVQTGKTPRTNRQMFWCMTDFGAPDYSNNAVDRFWILDANTGYTTKPNVSNTFTYIRNGASEIAVPNFIVETTLLAQRYNSTLNKWDDILGATNTDVTAGNTGTVSSGPVAGAAFYRSWGLFNDSAEITHQLPTRKYKGKELLYIRIRAMVISR